jgi:tetratricopeptide (TPR) repeat protein
MSANVHQFLEQAREARREGRSADAHPLLVEATQLARTAGGGRTLSDALRALAQIERDLHHPEAALPLLEEAVAIDRGADDALRLAHSVRHVADVQRGLKRLDLAEPAYAEALAIYRSHPARNTLDLANAIRGMALLKDETGDRDAARLLWSEAKDLYSEVGVEAGVAESTRQIEALS